jgi:uncharacterized protein (DUF885 family)
VPAFAERVDAFFRELFELDPLQATEAGEHGHDGRWPDFTDAGREARLAFADRWIAGLGGLDGELTRDEQIDRELIVAQLEALRFAETDLRDDAWDPLSWIYVLGGGLFPLLAREFAPLAVRLGSVAGRLEGMPAVIEAAKASLVGHAGRPVSRFHTETALRQLDGVGELIDDALREADAHAGDDAVAALRSRLEAAAGEAKAALGAFETHLRDRVLPSAEGEGRLGPELFETKMRHTLKSGWPSPAEILLRAEREYAAIRAEMVKLARDLWPTWCPDRAAPTAATAGSEAAADQALVRSVLDAIAADHPPADMLLRACEEELVRIEAFCRERDLVGLADEPLEIRWTPVFLRAFGGAMLDSPGPLDKGQKSFFSITPIPDEWTPEQAESYLREENTRQLRLLTIHEAVPGHYLQGVYANRCPSLARAVFWSGVFAEGWAVYVTQVMIDVGYGADDPALELVHWKFYLRSSINAIIDLKIHTQGMTEDEAVSLMVEGGFQEESEARNKYNRARLSSTQLSTYFVGAMAMWEVELERRRRLASRTAGPGAADAIVAGDLPGGLGETPGFRYREHLEQVMSHGSPPPSLLRRLVLPEVAEPASRDVLAPS